MALIFYPQIHNMDHIQKIMHADMNEMFIKERLSDENNHHKITPTLICIYI